MRQFLTPPSVSLRKRDKAIQEACTIAAEDDVAIMQMARTLAKRIPTLGIGGALRLLAAIGLAIGAGRKPAAVHGVGIG